MISPADQLAGILGHVVHHGPPHRRVRPADIGVNGSGHHGINGLVAHFWPCGGSGGNRQPTILCTQSRAKALSVMDGK